MFSDSLIMAGGSGTRLWPASSSRFPKQFLPAGEKKSFFLCAIERAFSVSETVIVITGITHINHVIENTRELSVKEKKRIIVIGEPFARNTAAAIACSVVFSGYSGEKRNMLVLTSDHIIEPLDVFKNDMDLAAAAANEGKLVVFGIKPKRAETGFGYIETEPIKKGKNIFNVSLFHEKPDAKTAEKYFKEKNFFWNSGMFAFSNDFMDEQFSLLAPDIIEPFRKLKKPCTQDYIVSKGVKILTNWKGLEPAYKKTRSVSFDYAIAEKCVKTAMIKASFNWIDIGNWEEYSQLKQCAQLKQRQLKQRAKSDKKNDVSVFSAESENCFIDSDIPIALAGVDDLIIVIRSGKNGENACALITKKGKTQRVKDIVEQIKNSNRKDLL